MTNTTIVNGITFEYWGDIIRRATFARNMNTGEVKEIHGGGYITRDITVRKAIMHSFHLPTFRK